MLWSHRVASSRTESHQSGAGVEARTASGSPASAAVLSP